MKRRARTGSMKRRDTLGVRIREARQEARLSQSQVSKHSGVSKHMLSRYENDHVVPSLATLERLCRAVGTPVVLLVPDGPEQHLLKALRNRGVFVRSNEEAEALADTLGRSTVKRSARGRGTP